MGPVSRRDSLEDESDQSEDLGWSPKQDVRIVRGVAVDHDVARARMDRAGSASITHVSAQPNAGGDDGQEADGALQTARVGSFVRLRLPRWSPKSGQRWAAITYDRSEVMCPACVGRRGASCGGRRSSRAAAGWEPRRPRTCQSGRQWARQCERFRSPIRALAPKSRAIALHFYERLRAPRCAGALAIYLALPLSPVPAYTKVPVPSRVDTQPTKRQKRAGSRRCATTSRCARYLLR